MTRILAALLVLLSFSSCKKAIEKKEESIIIAAMTSGQWKITSFVHNSTDITADFSTYKFQYYSNRTVDAFKNGTLEKTGSWDGDPDAMTTFANFPGSVNPLVLLNGTWHIDDNSWTYVKASQTVGGETKIMRLDKL